MRIYNRRLTVSNGVAKRGEQIDHRPPGLKQFNIPLVDLDRRLAEQHDAGFLWWDFTHLTSVGHRVAAEASIQPSSKRRSDGD